jgi:hypothetical protein
MLSVLGQYREATFYLLALEELGEFTARPAGVRFFRLVCFFDREAMADVTALRDFVECALQAGARSVICGGTACELVHDAFDDICVMHEVLDKPFYDADRGESIPTTWHNDESIAEVLWYARAVGSGHHAFETERVAIVVALLADDPRVAEITRIGARLDQLFQE